MDINPGNQYSDQEPPGMQLWVGSKAAAAETGGTNSQLLHRNETPAKANSSTGERALVGCVC